MELRPMLDRSIDGFFKETNDYKQLTQWIKALGGAKFCHDFRFQSSRRGRFAVESTLLHHAVSMKSNRHVRALLDVGVWVDAPDAYGYTALHYLCGYNSTHYRVPDSAELMAAVDKKFEMLKEAGASLEVNGASGETPLIVAAQSVQSHYPCLRPLVQKLVDLRADITVKNKYGQSMIHLTSYTNNVPLLKQLLDTDRLDINHQDNEGYTALFFANPACLALLLQRGADMSITANSDRTPLDIGRWAVNYQQKVDIWETEWACRWRTSHPPAPWFILITDALPAPASI